MSEGRLHAEPVAIDEVSDAAHWAAEEAVARERIRISRELHDQVASDLAGAVALVKTYAASHPEPTLAIIQEALESVLANVRGTISGLRPHHRLGEAGLEAEVRRVAAEMGKLHSIRVEVWSGGLEDELTPGQREVAFQVVREALTNVRKHAGASNCRIRLNFSARPFLVEVTDEGRGFVPSLASGYGIVGMRERAAGIGGRLEVVSTPGKGTTVFLFGPDPARA